LTPILVVDNSRRVVCRGHFSQDGTRIQAHLRFEDLIPSAQLSAARTVAEINNQVRARLEAVERRVRRDLWRARLWSAARGILIILGLIGGAWFLFSGLVWLVATVFGFSL
jgi:fatty acid desaturase